MPSIALPVSLRGQLLSGSKFSPYSLFTFGTQGIWLDPSDVANLSWRRNLLTWTEQFDNAIWVKQSGTVVTANQTVAPDATTTADLVVGNGTSGFFVSAIPVSTTVANTKSIWLRGVSGGEVVALKDPSLTLGTTTCTLTTTWQRFSLSEVQTTGIAGLWVANIPAGGIYAWGAQLELGSLTDYQRISDVNTEVIERFPNATMYQDAAGTTAVTTPGQPVGLRLDKSKGLALGAELVPAPYAGSGSGTWAIGTNSVTRNGSSTGQASFGLSTTLDVSKSYRVTFTVSNLSGDTFYVRLSNGTTNQVTANGTYSALLMPGGSTGTMTFAPWGGTAGQVTITNVTVRELPGNHATQSVLASRPVYGIEPAGGRRNLLTWTEDFRNTATAGEVRPWVYALVTVAANSTIAPNGTATADTLIPSTATDFHYLIATPTVANGVSYVVSFYAKDAGYGFIRFYDGTNNAVYTLSGAGAITGNSGGTSTITSVGDGWYLCTKVVVTSSTTQNIYLYPQNVVGSVSYAGNGTSGVFLWGAQLELGSTATNYQRVTTAFDVTEAGVQTCHYVQYDGSDDGMITNSIDFTATDKMSVFAGVRKNNDALESMLLEFSVNSNTNNGSFQILGPDSNATSTYRFYARGDTANTGYVPTGYAAPVTNVIASLLNLAGADRATEVIPRINGVLAQVGAAGSGSAGGGTFGNYPLYLGRRGGSSLPFSGRDYGIVVVGKATTAAEIDATEKYMAGKTGVTL